MADHVKETNIKLDCRQQLHTTVFSQSYSPCGKYLAVSNNYGHIAVYSLPSALAPNANEESWKPHVIFQAHSGPVYALTSTDRSLISAGTGDILAWKWSDITSKAPKVEWALSIPQSNNIDRPEINALVLDTKESGTRLFAGSGDNNIYEWDLESGELNNTYEGHTDYIHCLAMRSSGQQCLSGSEDGSVRIWDTRTPQEAVHMIEPYKNMDCARPHLGKWVGCLAVDNNGDEWMVCGGGPTLSLWHMRSLSSTTTFDTPNVSQQHVMFYEDTIVSAGSHSVVNHWFLNGDLKSKVPCTPTSVFNVSINQNNDSNKVLSVAGNTAKVDICTNFGYKAFSLTVC